MGEVFQEIISGIGWLWAHRTVLPNDVCIWTLLILAIGGCCLLSSHADQQPRPNLGQQATSPNDSSNHSDTLPQGDTPALKTHLRKLNNQLYQHIYRPLLISGIVGGIACWLSSPAWLMWALTLLAWALVLLVLFVLISHARQPLKQCASKIRLWMQKISEHTFWNITIWSICAIALFFIFAAFFTGGDLKKLTNPESGPRLVTTVIAMLGIITAAGALVMKYQDEQRKRADEGRKKRDEQRNELSAALERMGSSDSAMSRLAGVHTLVDVADKYEQYRAEVVRILCAYLRSDHSEDDPAIESAVLESLQDHYAVNESSDCQWSDYPLDIHGATIRNPFVFVKCKFKTLNLNNTTFKQNVKLLNCKSKEIEANGIRAYQDISLDNVIVKNPWHITLEKETKIQRFSIHKCSITRIASLGDISIHSTAINKSRINQIYLDRIDKINYFSILQYCKIQILQIYNCKIAKFSINKNNIISRIEIQYNAIIDYIKIQNNSKITDILDFFHGEIQTLSIEDSCEINNVDTTSGKIGTLEMYNGTINTLRISSSNEIDTFRQKDGKIICLKAPDDFRFEFQKGIIQKTIIQTNNRSVGNDKIALDYFKQYSNQVFFDTDKSI